MAAADGSTPSTARLRQLDRILDLVTAHEARSIDLEVKLAALKARVDERDVAKELDVARACLDAVARKLSVLERSGDLVPALVSAQGRRKWRRADVEALARKGTAQTS